MRCPKCQYISFENGDRCRNCGYEFSLTAAAPTADLPIQTGDEPIGPLADFALDVTPSSAMQEGSIVADVVVPASPRPITSAFDLPLFKERRTPEDPSRLPRALSERPNVVRVAAPAVSERPNLRVEGRPPLSVRRSTPTPPRSANRTPEEPVLGFGVEDASSTTTRPGASGRATAEDKHARAATASIGLRLLAGVIDVLILCAIGSLVLYLTLRICGLEWSRVAIIPAVPFVSFLLLLAGGYFTLFTAAGGQTIGKMAAGIKVVPMVEGQGRVPLGHSVLRAAAYAISAVPVGLGFVPALLGADGRAFHDRLADTRVIKA
jgi:uncharacterized RDD family membrane protein YckC